MRAYLLISGTIFALFAASHAFITYEHVEMSLSLRRTSGRLA